MLNKDSLILVCVDFQGNLAMSMHNKEALLQNTRKLISGIKVLNVPIIWTEQNPQKLGPTLPEIAGLMTGITPVSKMSFSCCRNDEFMANLKAANRRQILLAGIETHVCIYQTAIDLKALGYDVQVVADCASSRTPENKTIGLERIKGCGATVTTAEIVLFELLETAEAPEFREIVKIVK